MLSLDLLSAVIVDGFIYGFDVRDPQTRPTGNTKGILKCVELAIGIERWSSVIPGHASVTACGDSLILLNEAGTLMIVELSSEVYREVARRSLFPGKGCWIAPAIWIANASIEYAVTVPCVWAGTQTALHQT